MHFSSNFPSTCVHSVIIQRTHKSTTKKYCNDVSIKLKSWLIHYSSGENIRAFSAQVQWCFLLLICVPQIHLNYISNFLILSHKPHIFFLIRPANDSSATRGVSSSTSIWLHPYKIGSLNLEEKNSIF
jgi:hypothetical protein